MFWTGLAMIASHLLVYTMPDDMVSGAQAIVGLQGLAYIAASLVCFVRFLIRERKTIAAFIRGE